MATTSIVEFCTLQQNYWKITSKKHDGIKKCKHKYQYYKCQSSTKSIIEFRRTQLLSLLLVLFY